MKGKVYLVGAGPGDPELLTLKALRVLKTADAVLHDDLVAPEILNVIPAAAQVHNVGKRCGKKNIVQEEINFLMVALADSGLRVVRLKSGDPMIYGRAGEEIESLRRANISYEIVPGVTSALGAAEIIDRAELAGPGRPLGRERWAGAVDAVGSHTLANVLSQTRYGGAVAACGLAQGMDLPASVAPFILRGVTLCGVDSVMCPKPRREAAWARLARDLDLARLAAMRVEAKLDDVPRLAADIIEGKVRGRVVVDLAG